MNLPTELSFRLAYPEPEREGVAPFIREWGQDLMILKRIEAHRVAGLSLRSACREVQWTLSKFLWKRFCVRKNMILAAPRTPRTPKPDDPGPLLSPPMRLHWIHPDRTDYSPYPITLSELEEMFAFNPHRQKLLDGLQQWIAETLSHGFQGYMWIGGSFISPKELPSDIDVLLLVTAGPLLPWKTRVICFNGPLCRVRAKTEFKCDPFVIDCRSDVAHLPRAIAYWVQHFSSSADPSAPAKGFFEVELGPDLTP
jgi:hypothetical protein